MGIPKCDFKCIYNRNGLCTNKVHTYAYGRTELDRKIIDESSHISKCPHKRTY